MNTDVNILMANEPNILKLPKRLDAILKLPGQYITSLPTKLPKAQAPSRLYGGIIRTPTTVVATGHWSQAAGLTLTGMALDAPRLCCPCPGQLAVPVH